VLGGTGSSAVTVTSPAPVDAWTAVWESATGALPTQSPAWLRCVCEVSGWQDASRLYVTSDGRRLVLPLVRRSLGGGVLAVEESFPDGWGPGGLLLEGDVVRPQDVALVTAGLPRGRVVRVTLRPDPTTAATWRDAVPARARPRQRLAQTVFLDGGFDVVWADRFRSDTRRRVRKAERSGVVIERDDTGRLVPVFQQLYALSVERWARRDGRSLREARAWAAGREPRHKLATVATAPDVDCRLYAAWVDGEPAAAIVVLWGGTTAAYWRGAMDEQLAGPSYANYLLHRTAIQDAADAGLHAYHMGDSPPDSSLSHFKSRFGAQQLPYCSYGLERRPLTWALRARRRLRRQGPR
jgi:hypothetical protein